MNASLKRVTIEVEGIVQGVGFRPAVKRLADAVGIGGKIQNRSGTVRLAIEGDTDQIESFLRSLQLSLPKEAKIESLKRIKTEPIQGIGRFEIEKSEPDATAKPVIPADLAICESCLAEIKDPSNRRYGYPFTTCTACGPRFTVVNEMPYDRERTTMDAFPLCSDCLAEYQDPHNRRFHAESIACSVCGPKLSLIDNKGRCVQGDPLQGARAALHRGLIVAIRGVGGFQLAASALSSDAVSMLRQKKNRPGKPFAVMASDMSVVHSFVLVNKAESNLLASSIAPIVICDQIKSALLPNGLNPGGHTLGIMLPTTPLHHLLFSPLKGDQTPPLFLLVMTSGNMSSDPICVSNEEAFKKLAGVADFFLTHDREIANRADDSVCIVAPQNNVQVWRRARGFAPRGIQTSRRFDSQILALGNDFKNTVALGFDNQIVASPHIGDLETPQAVEAFRDTIDKMLSFYKASPKNVVTDLHPDMRSTRLGKALSKDLSALHTQTQHHHAHAASCMAEHRLSDSLAIVFDGTGMGKDGTIWGAELLHVYPGNCDRLGTFAPVPLPGGDVAIREPNRQLVARLHTGGVPITEEILNKFNIDSESIGVWQSQCDKGLNAPKSSAAGRLFDAVAAALGLAPLRITYESEPAVRLECAAKSAGAEDTESALPFSINVNTKGFLTVDWSETFRYLFTPGQTFLNTETLAFRFHVAVAKAAFAMAVHGKKQTSLSTVALSGGAFMNRLLLSLLMPMLEKQGFDVRLHKAVPPNDGGISIGQAAIIGEVL